MPTLEYDARKCPRHNANGSHAGALKAKKLVVSVISGPTYLHLSQRDRPRAEKVGDRRWETCQWARVTRVSYWGI